MAALAPRGGLRPGGAPLRGRASPTPGWPARGSSTAPSGPPGPCWAGPAAPTCCSTWPSCGAYGLEFDEAFGLTRRQRHDAHPRDRRAGGEIRWCDEAEVLDFHSVDRMTRAWVRRRSYRTGNDWSRVALALSGPGPAPARRAARARGARRWSAARPAWPTRLRGVGPRRRRAAVPSGRARCRPRSASSAAPSAWSAWSTAARRPRSRRRRQAAGTRWRRSSPRAAASSARWDGSTSRSSPTQASASRPPSSSCGTVPSTSRVPR